MASDERPRGMFGYEGEGFMYGADDRPNGRSRSDQEATADRGWNIGQGDDRVDRPSYRGVGPKNFRRSDDRICEDVCERLTVDHDVDASEIEVTVSEGVVTLSGTVHDRAQKRIAGQIADLVQGVKDVQNALRILR